MLKDQKGSHLVAIILLLLILSVIGLAGFKVFSGKDKAGDSSPQATSSSSLVWEYDQSKQEWFTKNGSAPECPKPLIEMAPVDMSKITAVLLPGTYRGFNYKAHGAFRAKDNTEGKIEVKLPMDANLRGITRYYESIPGKPYELQYLLTFENDCGIAFKFDHIYALTPDFQAVADKSPEPKKDDTRSDPSAEQISIPFKAGTVIATEVGFREVKNYGFDFGVYDYRSRNQISYNEHWAAIHSNFSAQDYHAVCWIPLLPSPDDATAEAMAKDRNNYNTNKPFNLTSDVCEFASYKTLDFNDGQPTDG